MAVVLALPKRHDGFIAPALLLGEPSHIAVGSACLLEDEPDELAPAGDVGPIVEFVGRRHGGLPRVDTDF